MKVVRCPPTGGIASVTSIGCAAPRKASRSIAGSTWTPSTIMPKKAPGDSSAAAIGPGSRLSSGRIALKRCVKPVRPSAMAARVCVVSRHRMAETDADAGLRQLAHEAVRHAFGRQRHQRDAGARRENEGVVLDGGLSEMARVVHARLFRREKRPLEMNAEHAGFARHVAATACERIFHFLGVSLIRVGRNDVVPNRRCAAAMVRMPSAVGASLNSTSPPPLTCMSMKPGASQTPSGKVRVGIVAGQIGARLDRGNAGAVDHDRGVALHGVAIEHIVGRDGVVARHLHRVRVTFCR